MARAKSTERAEARRRHRAAQAAARAAALAEEERRGEALEQEATEAPERPARPGLRIPDLAGDLRALPGMFLTRRLLWLPIALMLVAFPLALALPTVTDPTLNLLIQFYVGSFLVPQAMLAMFLGGFLAPRAPYLVGLLIGLINGALLIALFFFTPAGATLPGVDNTAAAVQLLAVPTVFGLIVGAFAAWYRDFLRQSSQRRRAALEARAREKRREAKRATRPGR